MGGWAVLANREYQMPTPLVAGLAQGVLTAAITLFLKRMIESIFHGASRWLRFVLPPVSAFLVSVALLTVVHGLTGTPALLATLSVPVTVSTLYALSYTIVLSRHV